eukprot:gene10737-3357_t
MKGKGLVSRMISMVGLFNSNSDSECDCENNLTVQMKERRASALKRASEQTPPKPEKTNETELSKLPTVPLPSPEFSMSLDSILEDSFFYLSIDEPTEGAKKSRKLKDEMVYSDISMVQTENTYQNTEFDSHGSNFWDTELRDFEDDHPYILKYFNNSNREISV